MTEQAAQQHCKRCDFEFPAERISCPSCGAPVAKSEAAKNKRLVSYFIGLVIFCALVILIAPR